MDDSMRGTERPVGVTRPSSVSPTSGGPASDRCDRRLVGARPVGGRLWVTRLDRLDQVLADPEQGIDLLLDLLGHLGMLVQERLGIPATLSWPLVAVGEERS